MTCFLKGVGGFLVAGLIAAIAIPAYGDYAARASVTQTLSRVIPLRQELEGLRQVHGTLTAAVAALDPPLAQRNFPGTDYLRITADGTIVFRNAKHGQLVVLEPKLEGEVLTWRCIGSRPDRDIPPDCR